MQINFTQIAMVAVGGMLGSVLRFVTGSVITQRFSGNFPWGTFTVNISGAFLIGLLLGLSMKGSSSQWFVGENLRLLLVTGFCGGFTTFSALSNEGFLLLKQGHYTVFFVYFTASILLGLAATAAGYLITK